MRHKNIILVLLLFFVCLLTSPLSFAIENVSRSPGLFSDGPRLAVDPAGNIHVVWNETYGEGSGDAFYAKYNILTGQWEAPLNLSNSRLVYSHERRAVHITIDPASKIYVIYGEGHRVSMRIFNGETWEDPIVIHSWSSGEADSVRSAVDARGNIYTIWWDLDGGYVLSRARVDGEWEPVQRVSAKGKRAKFPDIDVGRNAVFACWTQLENVYQIFYTRRDNALNASWSPPQIVYPGSHKQQAPAIKVDGLDIAHVVWTPLFEDGNRVVRYSSWTGNGFEKPLPISTHELLHYPYIHERGGNIYVAWQVGGYRNGVGIFENHRIGGTWLGQTILPNSGGSTYCDVATSPSQDEIYYVWDAWGEIWLHRSTPPSDPANQRPVADFSFSPTSGVYPLPVSFDASASYDPDGEITLYSWDFGDGGYATGRTVNYVYEQAGTYQISLLVRDNLGTLGFKKASITITELGSPVNVRWETFADESLFQSRLVTKITWEPNPLNDRPDLQIVKHLVWRKKTAEPDTSFELIGEVPGTQYSFLDKDVKTKNLYVYAVTVVDSQGNESPLTSSPQGRTGEALRFRVPEILKPVRKLDTR